MSRHLDCAITVMVFLLMGLKEPAGAQIVYSRWATAKKPRATPRKAPKKKAGEKGRGKVKTATAGARAAKRSKNNSPSQTVPPPGSSHQTGSKAGTKPETRGQKPSPGGPKRASGIKVSSPSRPEGHPPGAQDTRAKKEPTGSEGGHGTPRPKSSVTSHPRPNERPVAKKHRTKYRLGVASLSGSSAPPTKPMRVLKITVMGNEKTSDETIIALAEVHKGDLVTAASLDKIKKRLINTKLFKKVEVLWEESAKPGWAYLYLNCKDRWSWFIAPMFTYQKGRWGGALAYGEGNLLGLGKRIGLVARWLTDSQALAVGYQDPGMFGTHLVLKAGLGFERKLLKEYARIPGPVMRQANPVRTIWSNQLFSSLGLGYKWLGRLQTSMEYRFGLVALYDPHCPGQQIDSDHPNDRCAEPWDTFGGAYSSPIAFRQSDGTWKGSTYGGPKFWKWKRESILRLQVGYDASLDLFGIKQGWKVNARLDVSHPKLGSEFSYVRWQIYGYKAFRFFKAHVLELSGKHEESYGAPFHRENYMGGSSLPGFVYRQALGDTNTALRVAYTVPLFHVWWLYFRQVFYYKFAWIFFRGGGKNRPYFTERDNIRRYHLAFEPGPSNRESFLQSLGTGLRMYAKAVAIPLLGVDLAYGFEANAVRVLFYLGKNY